MVEQGRHVIRIHDAHIGHGNTKRQQGQRDYAFIDGRMDIVAKWVERSAASEIASLGLEEVKAVDGGQKTVSFDINNDEIVDEIHCTYWDRWGGLELHCVNFKRSKST